MKLSLATALALSLFVFARVETFAHARTVRPRTATTPVTFRLHVVGRPQAGTTFWVAYGPLDDRFGLLELRRSGAHQYAAQAALPTTGRTIFVYLAAHGVTQTGFGPAPGDPVTTIKTTGLVSLSHLQLPAVVWHTPAS